MSALRVLRSPEGSLLADMRLALLAEFGAHSLYGQLSRHSRDVELSELLARFRQEEEEQIHRLRALIGDLGGTSPAGSPRRRFMAWLLCVASRWAGSRIALRLCLDSEETIARWYAQYAGHLGRMGLVEHSRTCAELSVTKRRHALALQAWVER